MWRLAYLHLLNCAVLKVFISAYCIITLGPMESTEIEIAIGTLVFSSFLLLWRVFTF